MKKLLLIVLVFLIIGSVSAHEDFNGTDNSLLKDTQYPADVNDEDGILEVEQDNYIPVEVNVDEAWSLNVYIDRQDSPINGEYNNLTDNQIDIPTTVMKDGEEVPLKLGKHRIVYEFKFTNTTSVYRPEAYVSDSSVHFNFKFLKSNIDPQNSIYRFNSQVNILKASEPTSTSFDLAPVNITSSDTMFFNLQGLSSGRVSIYLDGEYFNSFEIDDNPYEDEIDTTKLQVGSYNLVMIVETENVRSEYNVTADTSDSTVNIKYTRTKILNTPRKYINIFNTTLNVLDFPEVNPIYLDAPQVDITYSRSIPVRFEGEGAGNMTVYIDGVKVYSNSILLTWENTVYVPTKNDEGSFFNVGNHDMSFEFVFQDKYARFNPQVSWDDNILIFDFSQSRDSSTFLNDKYIANGKLNIVDKSIEHITIECADKVTITHTDDINLEINGLSDLYDLTVFVDDVELYDESTNDKSISIKTFLERTSIEETNERDVKTGTHKLRFEFTSTRYCEVDAEFKNNALHFNFKSIDSTIMPEGVHYQLNTSLIVNDKAKTVHILKVKNNTYFDDTEFVVKMDLYKPEDEDDWEDDDVENPLGTQDVGIIVSKGDRIIYKGDDLMNLYKSMQFNYDFENENLPSAGTYTIKIINLADNTYDTASFEVKKANRVFNKKYSSDDFNVLFTIDFSSCRDDLNDPFTITLDGNEKTIQAKKGSGKNKREILFEDIDPGTYTATFTLKGNGIYNDVTLKSKVTVKKESPTIKAQSNGNKLDLTIDIPKSKSNAILTVSAGGVEKKFTVGKNTKYLTVEFNELASGTYDVDIDFNGNERYNSKTLSSSLHISSPSKAPYQEPVTPEEDDDKTAHGVGNNTGGIGTGTGDSNVTGSGNGTYNGKISLNGNGFNGDLGSQGSGHGDSAKGYEITKNIIKYNSAVNSLLIFLLIALVLLFLSFLYERRDNDEEEY